MPGTVTSKIEKINQVTRGWINYYALGSMKTVMAEIDAHLRTGLRIIIWKQWKEPKKRQWGLQKPGIGKDPVRSCQKTPLAGAYDFVRNLIPGMSINIKMDK